MCGAQAWTMHGAGRTVLGGAQAGWCSAVQCGAVQGGAVWCGAVWCGVVWGGVGVVERGERCALPGVACRGVRDLRLPPDLPRLGRRAPAGISTCGPRDAPGVRSRRLAGCLLSAVGLQPPCVRDYWRCRDDRD